MFGQTGKCAIAEVGLGFPCLFSPLAGFDKLRKDIHCGLTFINTECIHGVNPLFPLPTQLVPF